MLSAQLEKFESREGFVAAEMLSGLFYWYPKSRLHNTVGEKESI